MQRHGHSIQMNVDKLRLFIGLLLASGYVPLPKRRLCWKRFRLLCPEILLKKCFAFFTYQTIITWSKTTSSQKFGHCCAISMNVGCCMHLLIPTSPLKIAVKRPRDEADDSTTGALCLKQPKLSL